MPDDAQLQVLLGSLLGEARLEGAAGERRLRIAHGLERADYVWWKYERLLMLAERAPERTGELFGFHTITHPLFDDLAPLFASRRAGGSHAVRALLAPLGLAVWMTDLGRLELRPDLFSPCRRSSGSMPTLSDL